MNSISQLSNLLFSCNVGRKVVKNGCKFPSLMSLKAKSMLMKCNCIYFYTLHHLLYVLKGRNIKDQAVVVCFSYVGPLSYIKLHQNLL